MDDGRTRKRRPRSPAAQTRQHLLDAAAEVMERLGMANATTKEIARASGYSEATLYKHFADKSELFLEVMRHRFPPFVGELAALPERVGRGGVRDTLIVIVLGAVPFFRHGVPMLGSLFAEPALLRRHREGLTAHGAGPLNVNRAVAAYLEVAAYLGRSVPWGGSHRVPIRTRWRPCWSGPASNAVSSRPSPGARRTFPRWRGSPRLLWTPCGSSPTTTSATGATNPPNPEHPPNPADTGEGRGAEAPSPRVHGLLMGVVKPVSP